MNVSKDIAPLENNPKWIQLQEKAKEKALQFMRDPDLDHYAKEYIIGSLSQNTLKSYAADLKIFRLWCETRNFHYLPATAAAVANFLAAQAKINDPPLKVSTIKRRVSAIRYVHRMAQLETLPTDSLVVHQTLKGIMREKLVAPNKKEPATNDIVQMMADATDPNTLIGIRDRVIILLGFAGAFRRSELVNLKISDLNIHLVGMDVTIRKSKTDQIGQGHVKPIIRGKGHCPVEAVQKWLQLSGVTDGYLFRRIKKDGLLQPPHDKPGKPELTDKTVATIVKKYATIIGLNPEIFSGHSLRRGFNTSALQNGATLEKLMVVTGQKDPKTVLGYYKDTKKYEGHAGEGLL